MKLTYPRGQFNKDYVKLSWCSLKNIALTRFIKVNTYWQLMLDSIYDDIAV